MRSHLLALKESLRESVFQLFGHVDPNPPQEVLAFFCLHLFQGFTSELPIITLLVQYLEDNAVDPFEVRVEFPVRKSILSNEDGL